MTYVDLTKPDTYAEEAIQGRLRVILNQFNGNVYRPAIRPRLQQDSPVGLMARFQPVAINLVAPKVREPIVLLDPLRVKFVHANPPLYVTLISRTGNTELTFFGEKDDVALPVLLGGKGTLENMGRLVETTINQISAQSGQRAPFVQTRLKFDGLRVTV